MPLPALIFGAFVLLLLVGVVLVVMNAVRRSRQGSARIEQQGWRRLPDGSDVMTGWDGWPFSIAHKPGKVNDIVVGELEGVEFMSLRLSQTESSRGEHPGAGQIERYNMVALRCEAQVPLLAVVRGDHKVKRAEQHPGATAFDVGDRRFDGRWQLLGDAEVGRGLLVPEVREVLDDIGTGAWVFQPGWVVRVTPWTFWAGDDGMLEEVHRAASPWRQVPADAWQPYGGAPGFTRVLGQPGHDGDSPTLGPGRGGD